MPKKHERAKLFHGGKRAINISTEHASALEKLAIEKGIYPSQALDRILKKIFEKDKIKE